MIDLDAQLSIVMRQISPHTRALIDQLVEPVGLWEKLKGSREVAALLSAIGDSNETAALIDILPFVIVGKPDVAATAARSVHKLVQRSTTQELAWLDFALRQRSPYSGHHFYEWHKLAPDKLGVLERFGEASISLFGITSCHPSGYVREAAIKRLDQITSGAELPFLILRLNDWVSNVRDAAYRAIHSRLRPEYARHFIANLSLVSRLEKAGRADHKVLIRAINELLQSDECRSVLLESLMSADRFTRRASFRLALNSTKSGSPEIVRQALNDQDTVIRLLAAQTVSSAFERAKLDHILELMKRDRFMPVRREALRITVKQNLSTLLSALRSALLDQHPSMREEARYHMRKREQIDVAEFYREVLTVGEGSTFYAALCGLGEAGTTKDALLIAPHTSHPTSKIRWAAIKALAKLNSGQYIDLFMEALKDPIPYVSREALNALASRGSAFNGERIWKILQSATTTHVKRNAFSLIEKLGKWDSINYLVRSVRDSDETIAAMGQFGVQRWLAGVNRSFTSPSSEQLATLRKALEETGNLLDAETMRQLQFSMKGFN